MTIQALDFSSVYIQSIAPADAQTLRAQGFQLAQIGFDTTPESHQVRAALVGAGLAWDAYRFITWNGAYAAQVANVLAAIHTNPLPLPGYLWIDIEENTNGANGPSDGWRTLRQIMDLVEAGDVTPTSLVRPGFYTRKSYYEQWFPGYTEPADRGWKLWTAATPGHAALDNIELYGGWTQAEGVQYAWNQTSVIGTVDYSVFRDRDGTIPSTQTLEQRVAKLETQMATVLGRLGS